MEVPSNYGARASGPGFRALLVFGVLFNALPNDVAALKQSVSRDRTSLNRLKDTHMPMPGDPSGPVAAKREHNLQKGQRKSTHKTQSNTHRSHHHPESRIVNGIETTTDDYSYMVALQGYPISGTYFQFCGAALIRNEYPAMVLTAAHCLYDEEYGTTEAKFEANQGRDVKMYATLGKDDTSSRNGYSDLEYHDYEWGSFRMHKLYDDTSLLNDIAIVVINGTISDQYTPVALAEESPCCDEGYTLRVVGYGLNATNQYPTATVEYADSGYYPTPKCNDHFNTWIYYDDQGVNPQSIDWDNYDFDNMPNGVYEYDLVEDGMLCAWDSEVDACQGDSGGPLVHPTAQSTSDGGNAIYLYGLVSWGIGCDEAAPGVYADVGYYNGWIKAAQACELVNYGQNTTENFVECAKLEFYESSVSSLQLRWLVLLMGVMLMLV